MNRTQLDLELPNRRGARLTENRDQNVQALEGKKSKLTFTELQDL